MTKQIEIAIAKRLIRDVLAAGYVINVNDGEETVVENSKDEATILEAMRSTDADYLHFKKAVDVLDDGRILMARGWVKLIYGNGWDLISDYSDNEATNKVVEGALRLADRFERDEVPFDQASVEGDA